MNRRDDLKPPAPPTLEEIDSGMSSMRAETGSDTSLPEATQLAESAADHGEPDSPRSIRPASDSDIPEAEEMGDESDHGLAVVGATPMVNLESVRITEDDLKKPEEYAFMPSMLNSRACRILLNTALSLLKFPASQFMNLDQEFQKIGKEYVDNRDYTGRALHLYLIPYAALCAFAQLVRVLFRLVVGTVGALVFVGFATATIVTMAIAGIAKSLHSNARKLFGMKSSDENYPFFMNLSEMLFVKAPIDIIRGLFRSKKAEPAPTVNVPANYALLARPSVLYSLIDFVQKTLVKVQEADAKTLDVNEWEKPFPDHLNDVEMRQSLDAMNAELDERIKKHPEMTSKEIAQLKKEIIQKKRDSQEKAQQRALPELIGAMNDPDMIGNVINKHYKKFPVVLELLTELADEGILEQGLHVMLKGQLYGLRAPIKDKEGQSVDNNKYIQTCIRILREKAQKTEANEQLDALLDITIEALFPSLAKPDNEEDKRAFKAEFVRLINRLETNDPAEIVGKLSPKIFEIIRKPAHQPYFRTLVDMILYQAYSYNAQVVEKDYQRNVKAGIVMGRERRTAKDWSRHEHWGEHFIDDMIHYVLNAEHISDQKCDVLTKHIVTMTKTKTDKLEVSVDVMAIFKDLFASADKDIEGSDYDDKLISDFVQKSPAGLLRFAVKLVMQGAEPTHLSGETQTEKDHQQEKLQELFTAQLWKTLKCETAGTNNPQLTTLCHGLADLGCGMDDSVRLRRGLISLMKIAPELLKNLNDDPEVSEEDKQMLRDYLSDLDKMVVNGVKGQLPMWTNNLPATLSAWMPSLQTLATLDQTARNWTSVGLTDAVSAATYGLGAAAVGMYSTVTAPYYAGQAVYQASSAAVDMTGRAVQAVTETTVDATEDPVAAFEEGLENGFTGISVGFDAVEACASYAFGLFDYGYRAFYGEPVSTTPPQLVQFSSGAPTRDERPSQDLSAR